MLKSATCSQHRKHRLLRRRRRRRNSVGVCRPWQLLIQLGDPHRKEALWKEMLTLWMMMAVHNLMRLMRLVACCLPHPSQWKAPGQKGWGVSSKTPGDVGSSLLGGSAEAAVGHDRHLGADGQINFGGSSGTTFESMVVGHVDRGWSQSTVGNLLDRTSGSAIFGGGLSALAAADPAGGPPPNVGFVERDAHSLSFAADYRGKRHHCATRGNPRVRGRGAGLRWRKVLCC